MVKQLLKLYGSVVLHSVTLTVVQLEVPATDASFTREVFSFGLVPRDTSHTVAKSSVVGFLPHMQLFVSSTSPVDRTHTWGGNGTPFPPALQLKLSSAEVDAHYPEVLLGSHHDASPSSTNEVVAVRISFEVACSTTGFGAVY